MREITTHFPPKDYSKIVTFIILIILSNYMLLSYEPNTFPLPRKKKS